MTEMDVMCELASELVERRFVNHSYIAENGDVRYTEKVQDEFNEVLDILDGILNDNDN